MIYDAIVIGAGPAGSSAALALSRQGRRVAIVEKSEFPRRKVCGEFVSATSIALLDRLGVGEQWRNAAGPEIRRVALFSGKRRVTADMPPASHSGFGRALGRDVLDSLLLDAARQASVEVFQPYRALTVRPDGNSSAVSIGSRDHETILRAPIVIAAHGSWEPGALPSQLPKRNHPSDLLGFKAHFQGSPLDPELMPLLMFPGGYGGMVRADHGRLSVSCCIRRDALATIRKRHGDAAAEALQRHLVATCDGAKEAIGTARLDGPWLAAGPIRPGIRSRYADDIFRVGNIAGESHPIIAEGISMAIQAGWLLARELADLDISDRNARQAAGRNYSAAWRAQFSTRIRVAAILARIALSPSAATFAGFLAHSVPELLTIGARLSGKASSVLDRVAEQAPAMRFARRQR
ncbi:MAG: NAD(P)/FAD-dependent oxidoreductase [Pseudaminobacter sp.]|nr:NAD(P)/FAD-dependent oxidoreductase [Pseudaminobacter sp.]